MRKISISILALLVLVMTASGASAADYTIKWFNNMNVHEYLKNPDGFCTDLKIELFAPNGSLIAGMSSSVPMNVQTGTTMVVSTPVIPTASTTCSTMRLSGTCTYKVGNGPTKTEPTSTTVEGCSSGRAVFLNHNYNLAFYRD